MYELRNQKLGLAKIRWRDTLYETTEEEDSLPFGSGKFRAVRSLIQGRNFVVEAN